MRILLVLSLVLLGPARVPAITFEALPVADSHDETPGDGFCADIDGTCSIRAAVEEANALPGRDTIHLEPGYTFSLELGSLILDDDVDIIGGGLGTVIDGSRKDRIITIENVNIDVTLSNLELHDGEVGGTGGLVYNGGTLTITDARLRGGHALRAACVYNGGTITLRRVGIQRCTDLPPSGLGGAFSNAGTATLESVSITRGQARLGCGGGVYNTGTLTATNLFVMRNRARLGFAGGVCNSLGTIECTNCLIARNQAQQLTGGIQNDGIFRIWNTVVADNFVHRGVVGRFNDPNCNGTPLASRGYNIEDRNSCGLDEPTDQVSKRLRLQGPKTVKGTVFYATGIRDDSGLVDQGNNAVCPATDLFGNPRPTDGDDDTVATCDVGPVEWQP